MKVFVPPQDYFHYSWSFVFPGSGLQLSLSCQIQRVFSSYSLIELNSSYPHELFSFPATGDSILLVFLLHLCCSLILLAKVYHLSPRLHQRNKDKQFIKRLLICWQMRRLQHPVLKYVLPLSRNAELLEERFSASGYCCSTIDDGSDSFHLPLRQSCDLCLDNSLDLDPSFVVQSTRDSPLPHPTTGRQVLIRKKSWGAFRKTENIFTLFQAIPL